MTRRQKLLEKARNNPKGLRYKELVALVESFGYVLDRQRGTSHAVYKAPGRLVAFVLQPGKGGKAKPYQVEQVLREIDVILSEQAAEEGKED
jgi:predicted RNA binding protein YcfA (HicA-like mRNA interferase family)